LVFAKTELYTILYRICQNNWFSIFIKKFMLGHYVYDNGDIDIDIDRYIYKGDRDPWAVSDPDTVHSDQSVCATF
jgi:hypothetical protein